MNAKTLLIVLILSSHCFVLEAQQFPGATDSLPSMLTFSLHGNAFVLSTLEGNISPFYHASSLFHGVASVGIGKNLSVHLRIVSEVWSFSEMYDDPENFFTWAKPSIRGVIPVHAFGLDTITFRVGDLWRVTHAHGLVLDYFEAQGSEISLQFGPVRVQGRTIGVGIDYYDDIYSFDVVYNSIVGFHFFDDFAGSFLNGGEKDAEIFSVDADVPVIDGIHTYAEAGFNHLQHAKGLIVGVEAALMLQGASLDLRAEYRHYDAGFWGSPTIPARYGQGWVLYDSLETRRFPYFNSLTAIDKPINTPHLYMTHGRSAQTFSLRVKVKQSIVGGLHFAADAEKLFGTYDRFFYEAGIGYDLDPRVIFFFGPFNKIFVLDTKIPHRDFVNTIPTSEMFKEYADAPAWMLRIVAVF